VSSVVGELCVVCELSEVCTLLLGGCLLSDVSKSLLEGCLVSVKVCCDGLLSPSVVKFCCDGLLCRRSVVQVCCKVLL
jgi:hypothetical protein